MRSLHLTIIWFSSNFMYNTFAQLQPVADVIITFNFTGINYPKDILFFLYTRGNGENYQKLMVGDTKLLEQSSYNISRPTKLITHGWTANGFQESCALPRRGFLSHGDYNVIVVDWSTYSKTEYTIAASRVKATGQYVSEMIKFLVNKGSDIKQMSLVGHSLGAHIMGLAAHELSPKVAHLVGLDPARPGFELNNVEGRIHHTDADHVEIIHTNAGGLGFGFYIGDVDYWPNGGARQPGCGEDMSGSCAHGRAYMYYAESLENPDLWYAVKCNLYARFVIGKCNGNDVEPFPRWEPLVTKPPGNYMLSTQSFPLYGRGLRGARSTNMLETLLQ
ncbi:inactive pancreatic lipase-related protein 1-like [Copidosoma floridanum]|uniref:inactive pancreatic lipase-related protein 1-like n=1 Tax=Copidosoma floridanum TaxID=29053 RepID=UPI0006C9D4CC|nr:inactive pancreatic lipase-related protein 1-like [Copidosoma floridanum]